MSIHRFLALGRRIATCQAPETEIVALPGFELAVDAHGPSGTEAQSVIGRIAVRTEFRAAG
jgi:hypothetical protein